MRVQGRKGREVFWAKEGNVLLEGTVLVGVVEAGAEAAREMRVVRRRSENCMLD